MAGRTLLVTGGAGFIGANFILYWMKQHPEDEIINLDLLTYAGNLSTLESVANQPNYSFMHGSINDESLLDQVIQKCDIVVHFAAETHVDRSILGPGIFLETNVLGTYTLLEAARKAKISRFHHISTDEVFGTLPLDSELKFTESTAYDPRSPYSASKASSDHLVRAYGETYGLQYTITNCSNNYGEFQFPEKLIPLAITNLLNNQPVPIYGDGKQVRDWLYVQDHCRAIEAVLLHGAAQQTYLVGGLTEDISNFTVVQQILNLMGKSVDLVEYVQDRAGHDRRYSVDWTKISHELGWKPTVSFEEGLQKTIDWYTTNESWWLPLKQKERQFFTKQYANRTNTAQLG